MKCEGSMDNCEGEVLSRKIVSKHHEADWGEQ